MTKYDERPLTLAELAAKKDQHRNGNGLSEVDCDRLIVTIEQHARKIQQAIEDEREACAMIHESIDVACDHERQDGHPGAGAMGAVVEYRDLIRARSSEPAKKGEKG